MFFFSYEKSMFKYIIVSDSFATWVNCSLRGLGEKSSPSGEDCMLAVWSTTGNRAIPYTI